MRLALFTADKIIYQRRVGAYGPANARLMENFKQALKDNALQGTVFALVHDNPMLTPPEECRYDVALSLANYPSQDKFTYLKGSLPSGKYGVVTISHTAEAVGETLGAMFQLLDEAGYEFEPSRPIIERYEPKKLANHQCEICFPIK